MWLVSKSLLMYELFHSFIMTTQAPPWLYDALLVVCSVHLAELVLPSSSIIPL